MKKEDINEELSLSRVFSGSAYTVSKKDGSGGSVVVMEPLFAMDRDDAMKQVRDTYPDYPDDMFEISLMPGSRPAVTLS